MKKKTYEQPRVKVVELEQTDIICTSGSVDPSAASWQDLEDGEFSWTD